MTTPELDRQSAIIESGKAEAVQDLLDWLEEQGYTICETQTTRTDFCNGPGSSLGTTSCGMDGKLIRDITGRDGKRYYKGDTCPECHGTGEVTVDLTEPRYMPTFKTKQALMEDHFGIDPKKIEAERRALLAALRSQS